MTTTAAAFSTLASRVVRQSVHRTSHANVLLGLTSSSLAGGASLVTLCEADDDGVMDKLQKLISKDKDGNTDWNSTMDQVAKSLGSQAQTAIDSGIPTQISYGFLCGFCSGYALKRIGKAAAVVVGVGFMTLQSLDYAGYIEVNHVRLKDQVMDVMDINKDGKVDQEDGKAVLDKLQEIFSYNLPSGSGFGAGFLGGLRSG